MLHLIHTVCYIVQGNDCIFPKTEGTACTVIGYIRMGSSVFLTLKIRENKDLFVIRNVKVVPQVPKSLRREQE